MSAAGVAALPEPATLNVLPADRFADAVGPLFERAPRFLARLASARPFASWDELFDRALEIALAMPEPDQVELIDSHPRLGADPAVVRARSELSYREQGFDRPGTAAESTAGELARLNDAHEQRFGFRFVVFVAGRGRAELLPLLRAALEADRDAEIRRAMAHLVAIARDRRARLSAEVSTA